MRRKSSLLFLLTLFGCFSQDKKDNRIADRFKGYEEIKELKKVAYGDVDRSAMKIIPVDLKKKDDEIDLGKVIDSIDFVRLEMTQNSIVGHIDKIYFDDGKIFIIDRTSAKAVFIFDAQGKFINKIATVGKAPNEFLEIQDVVLDKENKRIILLDLAGRKNIFYDYNGGYAFARQMFFYFSGLELVDSSHIAFSTETAANDHLLSINNHYLLLGDFGGKVFFKDFPFRNAARVFTYFNQFPLKRFGDHVYFNPRFSDTLFEVKADRLIVRYVLDMKEGAIPAEQMKNVNDARFIELISRYAYFNGEYVETPGVLFAKVTTPGAWSYLFASAASGHVLFGNKLTFSNPAHNFFRMPVAVRGDREMVGWVGADEIAGLGRSFKKMKQTRYFSAKFRELLNTISDNDNPVLFIYRMNDF